MAVYINATDVAFINMIICFAKYVAPFTILVVHGDAEILQEKLICGFAQFCKDQFTA